jgi:Tfp pilus assembly protein PilN
MVTSAVISIRHTHHRLATTAWVVLLLIVFAVLMSLIYKHRLVQETEHNAKKITYYQNKVKQLLQTQQPGSALAIAPALKRLISTRYLLDNPVVYIAQLEEDKPDTVFFNKLSYNADKRLLQAIVVAPDYEQLSSYLTNLETSKQFTSVELTKKRS